MTAINLDINLNPSVLFTWAGFNFTTTFLLQIFITWGIVFWLIYMAHHWKKVPSKHQLILELLFTATYSQLDKVTQDHDKTKKLFPLIFTFFFYILIANLFTLIPGLGAINIGDIALFRSVLADYSAVLMMTLITVFLCQFLFIFYNGWLKYLGKWFNFKSPLAFVLGLMDIIGELSKVLSLSFRLFGNVFAGEVLLLVITSLVPFVLPLPFFVLTLFSSVIQAYVFALLSTIFISGAMEIV